MEGETDIFRRPVWVSVFATTAAIAWGWAYPLIKLGFAEFAITPEMTGSKMVFAGVRFCFAGLVILALALRQKRSFAVRKSHDWWFILVFTMLNTTLHYAFFYFGLSHSVGARAAILNSLGVFTVVIFACVFFPSDRFNVHKVVGCIVGFTGIMALNMGSEQSGRFTWQGDGFIILNALCSASASLLTRGLGKRVDIYSGTGYSLSFGGLMLLVAGLAIGGTLPRVTTVGIAYLLLLIAISALGFALYNRLIMCNPIGKVAIYNSFIPVVGAITSCMCLHETFYWKYLVAATLATVGIYLVNMKR